MGAMADAEVVLFRSRGQRIAAASHAVMAMAIGWMLPVTLAIGPWTWFARSRLVPMIFVAVGAVILAPALTRVAAVSIRLARMPIARIELRPQAIVIVDPSLFAEPVTITRSGIDHVAPAPSGRFSFGVLGEVGHVGAPMLSLFPERANCGIYLNRPMQLTGVRTNDVGGRLGLWSVSPIRPPHDDQRVEVLWLRTASSDGVRALRAWFDPAQTDPDW
jgi:hypothetical protein